MNTESTETKTWIFRHPLQVEAPPRGYRQVEVVRATPTYNQARNEVAKLSWVQQESISRRKAVHYSVRDYYTIIELDENSTREDALEAFFVNNGERRELIS